MVRNVNSYYEDKMKIKFLRVSVFVVKMLFVSVFMFD